MTSGAMTAIFVKKPNVKWVHCDHFVVKRKHGKT